MLSGAQVWFCFLQLLLRVAKWVITSRNHSPLMKHTLNIWIGEVKWNQWKSKNLYKAHVSKSWEIVQLKMSESPQCSQSHKIKLISGIIGPMCGCYQRPRSFRDSFLKNVKANIHKGSMIVWFTFLSTLHWSYFNSNWFRMGAWKGVKATGW